MSALVSIDGVVGLDEDLQAMIRLKYNAYNFYNLYSSGCYKRNKEVAVQQNVEASDIR